MNTQCHAQVSIGIRKPKQACCHSTLVCVCSLHSFLAACELCSPTSGSSAQFLGLQSIIACLFPCVCISQKPHSWTSPHACHLYEDFAWVKEEILNTVISKLWSRNRLPSMSQFSFSDTTFSYMLIINVIGISISAAFLAMEAKIRNIKPQLHHDGRDTSRGSLGDSWTSCIPVQNGLTFAQFRAECV